MEKPPRAHNRSVWEKIRETSPQLLFITALLLVGITFSLYKGVTAFSARDSSPEYRRTPSSAAYQPAPATVIPRNISETANDPNTGFRPTDDALIQAARGAEELALALEEDALDEQTFRRLGYRASQREIADLQRSYDAISSFLEKRDIFIDEQDWSREALSSSVSWSTKSSAELSAVPSLDLNWILRSGRWRLESWSSTFQ